MDVKRVDGLLSMLFDDMRHMDDEGCDLPLLWSFMHMHTSAQLSKLFALKRGMDPERCESAFAELGIESAREGDRAR